MYLYSIVLALVAQLNSGYVPTVSNPISYCFQLILFLMVNFVMSAVEGKVISLPLKPIYWLLSLF
jgi:hypothetical protein